MMQLAPIPGIETGRTQLPMGDVSVAEVSGDFEAMFAKVAQGAVDSMRTAEASAIQGISGDMSIQNVVRAMMTAEEQLKAAVAVRDRVVAAYQEISRMQI